VFDAAVRRAVRRLHDAGVFDVVALNAGRPAVHGAQAMFDRLWSLS
jgi:hypothetical protein